VNAIAQRLNNAFSNKIRAWAFRRHGFDTSPVTLTRHRIYILPTRPGLIFAAIVFTMLLGSMNYNNNMGFALTFVLTAIGIISIYHCHRNIADLQLRLTGSTPDFVGGTVHFTIIIENHSKLPRSQFMLTWDDKRLTCDGLLPGERVGLNITVPVAERGWVTLPRLRLSTRYPLGLLYAWSWINLQANEVVYPHPATATPPMQATGDGTTTDGRNKAGEDDFSGLRDYHVGDPPKHIAWKALARTGDMLVTQYESGSDEQIWIDWNDYPVADTEMRLSLMTRRLLDANQTGQVWGIRLPDQEISPGTGNGHRHACLTALALFNKPAAPDYDA